MEFIIGIILIFVGAGVALDELRTTRAKVIGYLIGGIGFFLLIKNCA